MKNRLVETLLDKAPISNELKEILVDQLDLSALITREIAAQIVQHGGRLKDEVKVIFARELAKFLEKVDVEKAVVSALENLELEIRVGFRRREKGEDPSRPLSRRSSRR